MTSRKTVVRRIVRDNLQRRKRFVAPTDTYLVPKIMIQMTDPNFYLAKKLISWLQSRNATAKRGICVMKNRHGRQNRLSLKSTVCVFVFYPYGIMHNDFVWNYSHAVFYQNVLDRLYNGSRQRPRLLRKDRSYFLLHNNDPAHTDIQLLTKRKKQFHPLLLPRISSILSPPKCLARWTRFSIENIVTERRTYVNKVDAKLPESVSESVNRNTSLLTATFIDKSRTPKQNYNQFRRNNKTVVTNYIFMLFV